MEKNAFLLYNDIVSSLYQCREAEDLCSQFLTRLRLLIPYSYASIFLADPQDEGEHAGPVALRPAMCVPASFAEAENSWRDSQPEDHLAWLTTSRESILVRESEVLSDDQRLNSYVYRNCYKRFNIYDTLQYAIISDGKFLGIITLFRTRIDEKFCNDDAFYLRSLGIHLSTVLKRFTYPEESDLLRIPSIDLDQIAAAHALTARESQIYSMLLSFMDNQEICADLGIMESTMQKHLQNLFRKLGVSSRWEAAARYYCPENCRNQSN